MGAEALGRGTPSPLTFFILFMEVHSKMLDVVASGGLISYHPRCKKLLLTHLCFADDLLVFTSATPPSLMGLKSVLD